MTDEELIREMAEIMGWRLLSPSGFMNQYFYEDKQENFMFWAEKGFQKENVWNPLTNANHWMMVMERMRNVGESLRLNFNCKIVFYRNLIEVEFWQPAGISAVESHDNIGHAICLAALKAWEAYKREIK